MFQLLYNFINSFTSITKEFLDNIYYRFIFKQNLENTLTYDPHIEDDAQILTDSMVVSRHHLSKSALDNHNAGTGIRDELTESDSDVDTLPDVDGKPLDMISNDGSVIIPFNGIQMDESLIIIHSDPNIPTIRTRVKN